jgi:putative ABC transport system ATP-binding protein
VAIARALVGDPQVVLADEPTGNLDSAATTSLVALLRQLNRQGATLVVVTHDPLVAAAMTRQVQLRDGQVVADSGSGSKGRHP